MIIDTDGGIDDMRSIVLMLSSNDISIQAITVSNGILPAEESFKKVMSLCHYLGREDIPVGILRNSTFKPMKYTFAQRCNWGPGVFCDVDSAPGSNEIIQSVIDAGNDDITLVCLGGLTTAMRALCQLSGFRNALREVIWSAVGIDDTCGFNYAIDKSAARFILGQHLPVSIVKRYRIGDNRFFCQNIIDQIGSLNNVYAQTIWECLTDQYMQNHEFVFTAADEMAALYLNAPTCFSVESKGCVNEYTPVDAQKLRSSCIEMLACVQLIPVFA